MTAPLSAARSTANRQNALTSTDPKAVEGKARSRLNALQHGLAGAGDLVAPVENRAEIERRTAAFARELEAPGELGRTLAHRAALLSVRMETCSTRDLLAASVQAQTARDEFDADRLHALEGWIKTLEAGDGDPIPAFGGLEATPDGLPYLIGSWLTLRASVNGHDRAAIDRARRWLGQTDSNNPTHLVARIDAEVDRLRRSLEALGDATARIDAERDRAGLLASFDPSPEASLARRYEAAAERGMYRAIRAINDLRKGRADESASGPMPTGPARAASTPPGPPPIPPVEPRNLAPLVPSLGSFRAAGSTSPAGRVPVLDISVGPSILPPVPPRKRPDVRKLTQKRR